MAPVETRIVTKRLREVDGDTVDARRRARRAARTRTCARPSTMEPDAIVEEVKTSGLRGRGGAGFGAGQKWSFLPKDVFPRYLCVNGDEGEPSTFKDHMLVERDPHQLIEGIVITAFAIRCNIAFIYLRGEFALGAERLEQALRDAYARNFVGTNILGSGFDLEIVLHRGAGCYIAGDETGLMESLEGERAMPRIKPPFPAVQGLYAAPTIVNNVETLSTVPHIIRMGGEEYAKLGVGRSTGTRIFSVSGHVVRPGNYEVELGMSFRDLIEGLAGGVPGGKEMKFFIPGGASSPWLVPQHLDAPLDMDHVQGELKSMLGSGAVMVFDEDTDPVPDRVAPLEVLRARELRQVHAVPRGVELDREGALPDRERPRPARRPRPPPRLREQHRPGTQRTVRADHHLRARAERDVAGGRPHALVPRRGRGSASARPASPSS